MLRRTVLSTLALLSLTSTAFGGVIWSSSGDISGQITGGVTETTWDSDYQIVSQTFVNLAGPCNSGASGALWAIQFSCDAGATGGTTWLNTDSPQNMDEASGGVSAESELTIFGALFVPGTGATGIQFDMSYGWWAGGVSSGASAESSAPVLILGASRIPIHFEITLECHGCADGELNTESYTGKAVATIPRGVPLPFSITYDSRIGGGLGHPSPSAYSTFSLDGISEVPEPASIAITAVGLLALAAWKSRRRRGEALRSI